MGQSWLSTVWTGGGPWIAESIAVFLIYYDFKLWFSEECSVPGSTGPRGGNGVVLDLGKTWTPWEISRKVKMEQ